MAKISGILFSLYTFLIMGVACAAEIKDAPIPEPNYVGIIVFLAIMFGVGGWFMWKVMTNKPKDDDKK